MMHTRFSRIVVTFSALLLVTLVGPHTEAAAPTLSITVPATATIGSTMPTFCGTTSTTITVTSTKKRYDLRIRAAASYTNSKAKNVSSEMVSTFEFAAAAGGPFQTVPTPSSQFQNVFSNQPTGSNVNHTVYYRQCVDWADDAGDFSIVVDYQVVEL